MSRRLALDLLVFALALGVRLGYLFGVDEPLLYTHHFTRALQIAAHPDPVGFVLGSDDWRSWGAAGSGGWTLAPLYYLFAAGVAAVFGPHLRPLQIVQCLLEALTAVGVARLGRAVAGPLGVLAGLAYAVHWQAVVFHSGADTENLHTVLFVWGLALLAEPASANLARSAGGGSLIGLSALARGVSLGFLPLAAAWRLRTSAGTRGLGLAAVTLGCGLAAVSPWTLRNYRLTGELVPIETVSVFNLWNDNAFVDEGHWGRQARLIDRQGTFAGKRAEALHFALLGWRRDPGAGLRKVIDGLEYFLRPTGAHELLIAKTPRPSWHHLLAIVFGDVLFALAVPLALSNAVAGPRSPARALLVLWLSYYLLLLVVVFHTQVRYRTPFTPVLFACAVGGWCVLAKGSAREKRRAVIGLVAGIALVSWASLGELRAASRAMVSAWTLRSAQDAERAPHFPLDLSPRRVQGRDRGGVRRAGQIQTASEEASGGPSGASPDAREQASRAGWARRASPCRLGHRGRCGGASDRRSAEDAAAPQRPDTP